MHDDGTMTRMPHDGPEGAFASNLRDLGGIPLAGGAVRHGLVYRSEAPRALQAGVLEELELRTVLDLRAPEERQRDDGRITNLPVEAVTFPSADVLGAATVDAIAQRAIEGDVGELMADLYRDFPQALAPAIGEAARSVVEGRAPILIHCAAGKDRTGFVCAVLLHLLGAEPESVVAEYLRSNVFFDEQRIIA